MEARFLLVFQIHFRCIFGIYFCFAFLKIKEWQCCITSNHGLGCQLHGRYCSKWHHNNYELLLIFVLENGITQNNHHFQVLLVFGRLAASQCHVEWYRVNWWNDISRFHWHLVSYFVFICLNICAASFRKVSHIYNRLSSWKCNWQMVCSTGLYLCLWEYRTA